MLKSALIVTIATMISLNCYADETWYTLSKTDEFTGEKTTSTYAYAGYESYLDKEWVTSYDTKFGLRCDVSTNGDQMLILTFSVPSAIATPSSAVDMMVKVDEEQPVSLVGSLYTNSYDSGYVPIKSGNKVAVERLIDQLKKGRLALVRVSNERRSEIVDMKIRLAGFTKETSNTLSACGFGGSTLSDEDKEKLRVIDAEIKRLTAEKAKILGKV